MNVYKALLLPLLFINFLIASPAVLSQTVYVTKTGEKYHTTTCRYLRYSKISISLKDAKEKGYTACKVCKPGTGTSTVREQKTVFGTQPATKSPSVRQAVSQQCSALTQAGRRCKRMTKSGSGKCWQHEDE